MLRRLWIGVEGLRIEAPGKGDEIGLILFDGAELMHGAGDVILEMTLIQGG